jgi:hypothetical protein
MCGESSMHGEERNEYRVWDGKPDGKIAFARARRRKDT